MGDKIVVLSHRPSVVKAVHSIEFAGIEKIQLIVVETVLNLVLTLIHYGRS